MQSRGDNISRKQTKQMDNSEKLKTSKEKKWKFDVIKHTTKFKEELEALRKQDNSSREDMKEEIAKNLAKVDKIIKLYSSREQAPFPNKQEEGILLNINEMIRKATIMHDNILFFMKYIKNDDMLAQYVDITKELAKKVDIENLNQEYNATNELLNIDVKDTYKDKKTSNADLSDILSFVNKEKHNFNAEQKNIKIYQQDMDSFYKDRYRNRMHTIEKFKDKIPELKNLKDYQITKKLYTITSILEYDQLGEELQDIERIITNLEQQEQNYNQLSMDQIVNFSLFRHMGEENAKILENAVIDSYNKGIGIGCQILQQEKNRIRILEARGEFFKNQEIRILANSTTTDNLEGKQDKTNFSNENNTKSLDSTISSNTE